MVYIFKTSIHNKKSIKQIKPHLNKLITISKWNFDLEDCDNILRIESPTDIVKTTIKTLNENGFECEELH